MPPRLAARAILAAALAAGVAPAALRAQPTPPPPAVSAPPIRFSERTLPNGLTVYAIPDKTTSDVSVQVFYGVGGKNDPQGRSGFAHLFEHMMFKATRDMPAEFMDRLTEDVGGENNASTQDDFTEYHETIPANHLQRLLWAEAERMSSLVVDQANFTSEREVVKEELRQRVLADPYGRLFYLAVPEASFKVHPYKRPVIGSIADLDAASLGDVQAFHATYYRPDNAALIVAGNFDQAQLDAWVDQYFGPIRRPKVAIPQVTAVEPPRTGPGTYNAYGPNAPLPAVAITWLAPDKASGDAAALTVLDAILTTGDSSRLYEDLVRRQEVASQVFSDADLRQQPGMFYVGAVLAAGKTLDQAQAGVLAGVARLRDQPPTEAELNRAKNQIVTQALRDRETVEGRGQVLGQAIELEGDAHRADADIAALQAVSAADVQRVARQYLTDDRRMVILYHAGPEPIPVGGRSPPVAAAPTPPVAEVAAPAAAPAPPAERQPPPPPGPPVQAALPAPAERTLPNGLKVIVARSTDIPLVTAVLNIGAGGADDPKALAGLADMTASLLSRGAAGRTAEEVAQAVEGLGGALQAGATWDGSQVGVTVLADKLGAALPILADIARRPTLSPQELEIQRRQSLDDLTVELQEPGAIARYAAQVAVFAGGPYGHVLGGTPASLGRITAADVRAFHDAWYRPDDAVLVLAGDIDPERGFALAEQAFGDWTAPAAPPPAAPTAPPASAAAPRVIVVDLPGAGQASVTVAEPAIRRADPRYYQAVVANTVLGGGYSARLNAEIRIKRGLSYGADSSLDARREPGMVVASAQTRNEAAPQVVELMLDQLRQMGVAPAGADELEARKTSLAGEYGRNLETTEGLARTLSAYAVLDIAPSEIGRYGPSVQAVTAGQAEAEAAALFDPARADIVVAGDAKAFIPALKAKYPNLELIPAAELDLDSPSLRKPAG